MRMRLGLAFAVLTLAIPASASAYVIGGARWPSRTITYFNADRAMDVPVELAVKAWNTSGARLRFVKTGRSRADVIIRRRRPPRAGSAVLQGLCEGYADIGYSHAPEYVDLAPDCSGGIEFPSGVVAHELGHILGLDHPASGCATMTGSVWQFCNMPAHGWQYRCRLLQPDDVRGAIALYGGHLRRKAAFCDAFAAPGPPANISLDANHASIRWLNPPLPQVKVPEVDHPQLRAFVAIRRDACPSGADAAPTFDALADAKPGGYQSLTIPPTVAFGAGTWCVVIAIRDQYGRGSDATFKAIVPPSPITVAFSAGPPNGRCATFTDASTDSDGHIIGWQWTFSDGTINEVMPTVTHCFPMSGSYEVALTVFDDHGRTATGSQPFATASPSDCVEVCVAPLTPSARVPATRARSW